MFMVSRTTPWIVFILACIPPDNCKTLIFRPKMLYYTLRLMMFCECSLWYNANTIISTGEVCGLNPQLNSLTPLPELKYMFLDGYHYLVDPPHSWQFEHWLYSVNSINPSQTSSTRSRLSIWSLTVLDLWENRRGSAMYLLLILTIFPGESIQTWGGVWEASERVPPPDK